jgi:hypothetical protein
MPIAAAFVPTALHEGSPQHLESLGETSHDSGAPDLDQGPVLVTLKYVIDPAKAPEFLGEIHKYQRIRRRDGAISWGVFVDTEAPGIYLESFKVDSWAEHERQHNRFTQADREIEKQVLSYALQSVEVKHYIYARKRPTF